MIRGFPGGSDSKESACKAGDLGLIPGFGRSPGEGNGYPLPYSRLENPTDRGAWCGSWNRKDLNTSERPTLHFQNLMAVKLYFPCISKCSTE